jgi:hypothetical protein
VIVALLELQLDSDASEERGRRVEQESVEAWFEIRRELCDASVTIRLCGRDEVLSPELHANAGGRTSSLDVEHVRGD